METFETGAGAPAEETSAAPGPGEGGGEESRADAGDREVLLDVFVTRDGTADRASRVELPDYAVYERAELTPPMLPREERVRRRAHEIYIARTRLVAGDADADAQSGDAVSDWLAAERELLERDESLERR